MKNGKLSEIRKWTAYSLRIMFWAYLIEGVCHHIGTPKETQLKGALSEGSPGLFFEI